MAHFAHIDENSIVTTVIVAEQNFIDSLEDPENWVQTSYNTSGGVHLLGGEPLRKNFASQGYTYDPVRDAFIAPQPYPSWTLNEETCLWVAPIARPENGPYFWNEETQTWVEGE